MKHLLAESNVPGTGKVLSFCFLLAAIAGFFHALSKRLSWRDTLVAAGASGVGGLVVGALGIHYLGFERWYLICAGCGLAGWIGGNVVLDRLGAIFRAFLDSRLPRNKQSPPQ